MPLLGIPPGAPGVAYEKDAGNNAVGLRGSTYLDRAVQKIARSIAGAERNNRFVNAPFGPAPTWAQSTVYTGGLKVRGQGADAANLYLCVGTTTQIGDSTQAIPRTGTSAASGNGPSGTGIPGTAGVSNVTWTSITVVGSTATAISPNPHGLGVGYQINNSGSSLAACNGVFNIATVVDPNTVTFTLGSAPGSSPVTPGSFIVYNTIVDGTVVWTYFGKATATGTTPLYSTVTPTTAASVMDGFVAIIPAANYTALGLVPTTTSTGNPKFKVGGVLPAAWGTFQGAPAGAVGSITRPVYYTRPYIEVVTNSLTWIAIQPQASMTQYLQVLAIEVNGQWISESSFVSRAATGTNAYLLNLAPFGPSLKHIKIFYKAPNIANAANLPFVIALPNDTFANPPQYANPIRAYIEGDSTEQFIGLTASVDPQHQYESMMGAVLGFSDVYNGAVGGTGVIATGGNTNYPQRINDVILYNPDIIIIGGFHNDNPGTGAPNPTLQAAALSYFQLLRTNFPFAPIIINPYHTLRGESIPNATATENDILAAFNNFADSNSLFIPVLTAPSPQENANPGRFFVNVAPYTDTHPWVLSVINRIGYESIAIKNFFASKV